MYESRARQYVGKERKRQRLIATNRGRKRSFWKCERGET